MLNTFTRTAFILLFGLTLACGKSPEIDAEAAQGKQTPGDSMGKAMTSERQPPNQQFRNLDALLAHLELQGHLDGKWYKEIRPGIYELQTGNLHLDNDLQQRIFTREELEWKFGFLK